MADVVDFLAFLPTPDLDGLSRTELEEQLSAIRAQIVRLNAQEPEDMNSEAYALWGERHEMLEDLEDDLLDHLDMLSTQEDQHD